MKPAKTWYSIFDRELLIIYLAICHFHHTLELYYSNLLDNIIAKLLKLKAS